MWNTQVLGRASLGEQNLAPESGRISLSLSLSSGAATDVFRHQLESLAEREFRSECISRSGRVLSLAASLGLVEL